ncbi:hypothetical protein ACS5NO_28320 [Larkinella sp. GY13]|uniref:hypothetical protein n=1 Tax=Larkinella sp. GY13 TaxID=3453720 RepID=UPI003EEF4A9C
MNSPIHLLLIVLVLITLPTWGRCPVDSVARGLLPHEGITLDLSLGYALPQRQKIQLLVPASNQTFGGASASLALWKYVFTYGDGTRFFDLGADGSYLPFVQSSKKASLYEELRFYVIKAGVRHSMYFLSEKGFEQSVMIGLAFPGKTLDRRLRQVNPTLGGYFGYFTPVVGKVRFGIKWNWNFIRLPSVPSGTIYAHVFNLAVRTSI